MEILSVLIAAVAGFATGAAWYMVLGGRWMAAVGKTEEEVKASRDPLPFVIAGIGCLATAGLMRHIFAMSGIDTFGGGLIAGLGIGLFMTAPWIVTNYAFAERPKSLWLIDAGHAAAATTVIGTVLGLMR